METHPAEMFSLQKVQLGFLILMRVVNSGMSCLSEGAQILYSSVTLRSQGYAAINMQ